MELYLDSIKDYLAIIERAIFGNIMGKRLPFFFLKFEVQWQWGQFGEFQLSNLFQDYFARTFTSMEALNAVLCGQPWFIEGITVWRDKWTPTFYLIYLEGLPLLVWIKLPFFMQYWDVRNLTRLTQ